MMIDGRESVQHDQRKPALERKESFALHILTFKTQHYNTNLIYEVSSPRTCLLNTLQ